MLLWFLLSLVKVAVHVTRQNRCSIGGTGRSQKQGGSWRTALTQGQGQGQGPGQGPGQALPCCENLHPGWVLQGLINHKTDEDQRIPEPWQLSWWRSTCILPLALCFKSTSHVISSTPVVAALFLEKFSNKPWPLWHSLTYRKGSEMYLLTWNLRLPLVILNPPTLWESLKSRSDHYDVEFLRNLQQN